MADPQAVEQDLREYLFKADNIREEDRIKYLMSIFNKHAENDTLTHVISPKDLHDIVSAAVVRNVDISHTLTISGKSVGGHDPAHIAMIESVIGYLNRHSLLKRLAGFEYGR